MALFQFDANTTRWSARNALLTAEASQLAYGDSQAIQTYVANEWGLSKFHYIERQDTQCFIAGNDDLLLIAFRGTQPDDLRDWMTDVDLKPTDFPAGGQVHEGFFQALNFVWRDVLAVIRAEQTNAQSLWITGHSLGAALATLAAARFRLEQDKPVNGLYTFGSPRVGDRDFAIRFNLDFKSRAFRYVNNNDVVTRVPLREMEYSHVGTFLYYDAGGVLQTDLHWWNKFLETIKGEIEDFLKPGLAFIKDHFISNYVENARKNLAALSLF